MCLHILNMSVIIILQWFQDSYVLSYTCPQMYLFNFFHWLLSILPYLTRQQIIYASGHAACWSYPCHIDISYL